MTMLVLYEGPYGTTCDLYKPHSRDWILVILDSCQIEYLPLRLQTMLYKFSPSYISPETNA